MRSVARSGHFRKEPPAPIRTPPEGGDGIRQSVRFTRSVDGAVLAYAVSGRGPPLAKAANWLTHLEFDWESPVWKHWLRELSRDHTLVRYDERGCGLSDRVLDDLSFEAFVADLEAVVDAAGLDRIKTKTVKNHVTRIFAKLSVNTRPEAIVVAREAGLGRRNGRAKQ